MSVNIQLKSFFDELVSNVILEFPDQIVSMALFGSATTDEWIRGKSLRSELTSLPSVLVVGQFEGLRGAGRISEAPAIRSGGVL